MPDKTQTLTDAMHALVDQMTTQQHRVAAERRDLIRALIEVRAMLLSSTDPYQVIQKINQVLDQFTR